jgi:membrane protein implicated in regulation of membrane protease activity
MKKQVSRSAIPTIVVSFCLLLYSTLAVTGMAPGLQIMLFVASPFLVTWLVVTVLKDKKSPGRDLMEDEEWGYRDRKKSSLGTF